MPTSGSSGRDNRVRPHDHSSDETGGDVLRPKHLASKQFPVVDVRAYGVEGDGETDDAVAFQRAVDAATPNGVLYVPYNVDLHFESPVDVDLGLSDAAVESDDPPQTPFSLICEGTLNPAPGLGTAVHIHHGHFPYVRVRVQGGGADLSDTAIRVSDVVGGLYEGFATDYSGVVYKFDNGGTVTRGVSVGTLNAQAVGQALLMEAGPAGEMLGGEEGIGEVYDIWDGVPTRGIEFRNVRGLSLNQYENAVDARFGTEQSMVVEGCEDVAIDKVAVGGIGSEFPLVVFRDVDTLNVSSIFSIFVQNDGVVMDSVRNANIDRVMTFALAGAGVRYRETGDLTTENNRVLVDAFANDGHPLVVEDSVSGSDHLFSGTWLINGEPGVVESSADNVQFLDAWSNLPLVLPDDNDVRLFRSDFPSLDGSPKTENYVGSAAGTASTPDAGGWDPGDVVFWTDEDGDDDGVYLRGRDQTWTEIGEVQ